MTSHVPVWRSMAGVAVLVGALGLTLVPAPAVAVETGARIAGSAPTAVSPALVRPVLARGSTGRYVRYVQRVLGVSVTGYYGLKTQRAVRSFQRSVNLKTTGRVGPRTWAAVMRKAQAEGSSRGVTTTDDPTMTSAVKGSKAARSALGFDVWLTSAHGRAIVRRESGGRCTAVSSSGAYRGKWQMGSWFWKNYGGTAYAATPDKATCREQDTVAYKGWVASWWGPWGG